MTEQYFKDVYKPELSGDAIINDRFFGFQEDYLLIHSLLREYPVSTFCEIGTNTGFGTKIIDNALKSSAKIYSIDLPDEVDFHPEQPKGRLGIEMDRPYTQIRANTLEYAFSQLGEIEGFFIDGGHYYKNVLVESQAARKAKAKIVIWHDANIEEVTTAIVEVFDDNKNYDLYRVIDTRISYAIRK